MPCLLFVFAHPDDESFSGAGTAMCCAAAGARIVLLTATRGERGRRGDPPVCTEPELPACRERELREAAAIIGVDALHLLDYRDRELADAPPDALRGALVGLIRRERPDIVLTFDPHGFNRHPDHVAISRFTSDAIAAAADARWHEEAGPPHRVPRLLWTPPVAPWDVEATRDPATIAGVDLAIDVSAFAARRAAALQAHRSQHLSTDRYFFQRPDVDRLLAVEWWRQAFGPPLERRPLGDPLAGLALDQR
jgi:LmbE family N-acetylglucosaminyl deacetylase